MGTGGIKGNFKLNPDIKGKRGKKNWECKTGFNEPEKRCFEYSSGVSGTSREISENLQK